LRGGISRTFEAFCLTEKYQQSIGKGEDDIKAAHEEFARRKGPDFVSRLRGHINIFPLDTNPTEYKHVIRRAIYLRSMLEWHKLVDAEGNARIDEDIVYAILSLDRFRHGTRSMEAIIEMCSPIDGFINKASLPSRDQLNMHLDSRELYLRMDRSRIRKRATVVFANSTANATTATAPTTPTAKQNTHPLLTARNHDN
jgi:hypothetical protein